MQHNVNKKAPQRHCTGCGACKDKKELLRVVRTPDGKVCADLTGKASGRGAYVCKNPDCLKKALKGKLARSLECSLSPELQRELAEQVERALNDGNDGNYGTK